MGRGVVVAILASVRCARTLGKEEAKRASRSLGRRQEDSIPLGIQVPSAG
jgi:hypothetical protein